MSNEDERVLLAHTIEELSGREPVRTPVQVFTVSADGPGGPLIGGTIAVLSGSRDSALLERARVLAASGDVGGLGALLAEWRDAPSRLRRGGGAAGGDARKLAPAWRSMSASPR